MINTIKSLYKSWFKSCENNESIFVARITLVNMQRIRAIAFLLIFIMLAMILFDMASIGAGEARENYLLFRPWFISLRLLFIVISIIFITMVKLPEYSELVDKKHHYYMISFLTINLVLLAIFTALVQTIRDDISAYLIGIFFTSSFLYLNRRQCNLVYGTALISMGIGTWLVQIDKGIFVYNMINALILTALAWIASQVLYANRIQEYRSQQLIEQQTAQLAKSNSYLEQLSYHDALTALPNRRYFEKYLYDEWNRARSQGTSISLLLADIDNFKEVNDNFGHQVGDNYLKEISVCLSSVLSQPNSLVARLGGDEYAVVLPDTDLPAAQDTAYQMLYAVQELNQIKSTNIDQITISLGVCSSSPSELDSLPDFFTQADNALYRAKEMGRNQVAV